MISSQNRSMCNMSWEIEGAFIIPFGNENTLYKPLSIIPITIITKAEITTRVLLKLQID